METKIENFSRKWLSLLVNGVIGAAALAGVITMQSIGQLGGMTPVSVEEQKPLSAISAATFKQAAQQEAQQEALRLKMLKNFPSFGFDNLIADWTFLKFLQYFGDDEARNVTGYNLSKDYFDIITQRDPKWADIYLFLSTAVSFYQGKPETAVKFIERGTRALAVSPQLHSQSWIVWRTKGLDELLLLGDIPESIRSHEMAAEWVEKTQEGKKLAPLFRATAEFLRRDPDSVSVRFNAWSTVYYQTTDKLVRQRAKQALVKLGARVQKDRDGKESFSLPSRN
ncbi:MAG: hypothetical protein JGK30_22110 [Microcoleus sp. PH2017_40_RAT_O_B]|uniref:hypothetical protein n=1 Tax=unclassified Microcoleus TaxID=2642155 RepID=UPI001D3DC385|nr:MULTISPECIES: hypothetical protein [unclassified Microcoleus]MCC3475048.1 hypothetical protein [Microcoleus sp. PH2017_13_LAR_U_A]MCC3487559.1 hypothetical protein [Microcoleus sp. PH2017_14_LAR_D_A]MCC3574498.1 hypothetical protein [Microcoleus sp. PH2017_34_RAT_O_A]MCC3612096.1 hypothetical protein [Microcoleus sp. PH2017_40_RAT_O_B]